MKNDEEMQAAETLEIEARDLVSWLFKILHDSMTARSLAKMLGVHNDI